MRSQFSRTAAIFFNSETLLPFLLGSVFLAVLGNAVWQILIDFFVQHTGGNTTLAAAQIAFGALLIFSFSVVLFARGLRQLEPQTLADARIPKQHRGLILLVSKEIPCRVAIQHHLPRLERCWLLCSDETRAIAESLQQEFSSKQVIFKLVRVNDVHEPMEFYQHIRRIYTQLPSDWSPQQIIADYTGMTAHASVGMVLASLAPSPNAPLQYTPVNPSRTNQSLTPIEIVLRSSKTGSKEHSRLVSKPD